MALASVEDFPERALGSITREEEARILDSPQFEDFVLKEYEHWRLYLNQDQRYFGRVYIWLTSRHVDAHQLTNLHRREIVELFDIMAEYEAVCGVFGASMINAVWLGNELHLHRGHGHMHLIPRYVHGTLFEDSFFADDRFGKNYTPYEKLALPKEKLFRIRDHIKTLLL